MGFMLFISFFLSLFYGGIWICVGILLRNHLDTVVSFIMRRPIPEGLISPDDYGRMESVVRAIGLLFILIGIFTMILGLATGIASSSMQHTNFNYRFGN
jgi:hypothetical protein